ncbi:MAG: DUF5678 domain-containing protein [Patescibacteria group bacterium]|nr:DUF5678 domain-containing protein [Patescibacteria group bacterium]
MDKSLNFTQITKKYRGKWIGLTDDEKKVISSGKTAKEALEKAKKRGYKNPILFKVSVVLMPYVGNILLTK